MNTRKLDTLVIGTCAQCQAAATLTYAVVTHTGSPYLPVIEYNTCSLACANGFMVRLERVRREARKAARP